MMQNISDLRSQYDLLALVELLTAFACGLIWYMYPQSGAWPLLLIAVVWVIKIYRKKFPIQRTRYDFWLVLFLLTAVMGIFTAYNTERALAKFWLILDAVLIYYALAAQPKRNIWLVMTGLGYIGAAVGLYFLFTNDWNLYPAKVEIFNQWGMRWMAVRPDLGLEPINSSVASGVMGLMLPFQAAAVIHYQREKMTGNLVLNILSAMISVALIVFATTRGVWLVLILVFGLWAWWVISRPLAAWIDSPHLQVFTVPLLMLAIIFATLLYAAQDGGVGVLGNLPGYASPAVESILVHRQTTQELLYLIQDHLIIGAGLDSFPGLYSVYITYMPSLNSFHGHNLLLDTVLQQGPLGGLALLFMFTSGVVFLVTNRNGNEQKIPIEAMAVLASLSIVLIHGYFDDVLYGTKAVLFIFTPFGFLNFGTTSISKRKKWKITALLYGGVSVTAIIVLIFYFRSEVLATYYANLGAIKVNKYQLRGWTEEMEEYQGWYFDWLDWAASPDDDLKAMFHRSNSFEENRTANHYLGLLMMHDHRYTEAIEYLEKAKNIDPSHYGVRKALAYSYLWDNDLDFAENLFRSIFVHDYEILYYENLIPNYSDNEEKILLIQLRSYWQDAKLK